MLVLTDSAEPGRSGVVSEADLRRSRILCSVADSVFAIGCEPNGHRYIIQTRQRNAPILWNPRNAPVGVITRPENGLLGILFDERFEPRMDEETRLLICRVRAMRDGGATYRDIAKALEISKTRAVRLYKKWTPAMGTFEPVKREEEQHDDAVFDALPNEPKEGIFGALPNEPAEQWDNEVDDDETDDERWEVRALSGSDPADEPETDAGSYHHAAMVETVSAGAGPPLSGTKRRSVYDLERGIDTYGREIFIESVDQYTGKPKVWYRFDNQGKKVRSERKNNGIFADHLDASPYL
jgi:hypothetical protein